MEIVKQDGIGAGTVSLAVAAIAAAVAVLAAGVPGSDPSAILPSEPAIEYLAPENAVWVRGFHRDAPATMDDLLAADRQSGWGLVRYEPSSDTTTLNASLWIGGVSIWDPTHVQIGRPGHERETLIVEGFVWIRPPRKSLAGLEGKSGLVNRLTLGDATNSAIRATLNIDCQTTPQSDGLFMGDRPYIPGLYAYCGGDLFVFNSVIVAAPPDPTNRLPEWVRGMHPGCYGTDVRLSDARLSRVGLYGINPRNSTIERTVFENGRSVFSGGFQRATDCVFRNLKCPVTAAQIELIRCSFESNAVNWSLQNAMGSCVEAIDCRMGAPKAPVVLRKNTADPRMLLRHGIPIYPLYIERRSLVVKVTDPESNPVANAVISLSCPAEGETGVAGSPEHLATVRNPVAVTDRQGLTPRKAEDGALLPTVRRLRATEDPLNPREETFAYQITVEAAGYRPGERMLTADELAGNMISVIVLGP